MKAILFAAVIAVSVNGVAPTAASAQTKPNMTGSVTVDLRVCNQSGRDATVGVSYVEVDSGRFINRGWYEVANGVCSNLVSTDNSNFYMYADATDGSNRSWSGSHTLCVRYPGPYTFWSDGSDTCPSGYETRDFVAMHADEPGTYTWTLDP